MPNKKGGKKFKKHKKQSQTKKQLIYREDDSEEYAQVTKVKGSGRFDLKCNDGKERIGIIRGKMRKKTWINQLDIVLIAKWDFEDNKCSIIHKYSGDEVESLRDKNELNVNFKIDTEEMSDDYEFTTDIPESESSDSDESDEEINMDDI